MSDINENASPEIHDADDMTPDDRKRVTIFSMPSKNKAAEFYTERFSYSVYPSLQKAFVVLKQDESDGMLLRASANLRVFRSDELRSEKKIAEFLADAVGLDDQLRLACEGKYAVREGFLPMVDKHGKALRMQIFACDPHQTDGVDARMRSIPMWLLHKALNRGSRVDLRPNKKGGGKYFEQAIKEAASETPDAPIRFDGWVFGQLPKQPKLVDGKAVFESYRDTGYLIYLRGSLVRTLIGLYLRMEPIYRKMIGAYHDIAVEHEQVRGLLMAPSVENSSEARAEGEERHERSDKPKSRTPRTPFRELPPEKQAEIVAAQDVQIEEMKQKVADEPDADRKAKLQKKLDGMVSRAAKARSVIAEATAPKAEAKTESAAPN